MTTRNTRKEESLRVLLDWPALQGDAVRLLQALIHPSSTEANLDCRLVPGQTAKDMTRETKEIVGPEIELEATTPLSGAESRIDTPLLETIVRNLKRYDPEAKAVPMLTVDASDGRLESARGVTHKRRLWKQFAGGQVFASAPAPPSSRGNLEKIVDASSRLAATGNNTQP